VYGVAQSLAQLVTFWSHGGHFMSQVLPGCLVSTRVWGEEASDRRQNGTKKRVRPSSGSSSSSSSNCVSSNKELLHWQPAPNHIAWYVW
jgi:hypothetical protein